MKNKLHLELRAAVGGDDSKLLIKDMMDIYIKVCRTNSFEYKVLEQNEGLITIWISGNNAKNTFSNEEGSHRWQRVPPTERKGRVHTSSITVAILDVNDYKEVEIRPDEIRIETTRGSGSGGQRKNVTDNCVVMTHLATGLKVVRDGRQQHKNKEDALEELTKRVNNLYRTGHDGEVTNERREQIGDGARSDKRRTYRVKDSIVIDHITGKTASLKDVMRGKIELLS